MTLTHTGEATELLQALIRNACVNDGTPNSGEERRNADTLQTYLEGAGLDVERFTPHGDRTSVVARIEGSDPSAPKLCLMGHTDVVPVSRAGWSRDPVCGDVVDGEVWGRGAIDMLNITASMAVAFKELARTGFQPKGDIIYFGVADEEAGGVYGAKWMVDHHWDAIACDYVLTEMGGWSHLDGRKVGISVGEKGIAWRRITVKGTPGHGSMPYGANNAVIKAAEVVKRLSEYHPTAKLDEMWAARVMATNMPDDVKAGLLDPNRLEATLAMLPVATANFAPFMYTLSIVAVVYTSLVAFAQTDMKKLIAYSSVAHMGFVTMGLFTLNAQGIQGAMFQMVSHGLVSGALFLSVGVIYDRMHTREIAAYGGLVHRMPRYAAIFMLFTMANVGLPGTSGFVGEFLTLLGAFRANTTVAFFATTGVILSAGYALWLYARVIFGKLEKPSLMTIEDINPRELAVMLPLVVLTIWYGIQPNAILDVFAAPTQALLKSTHAALESVGHVVTAAR